MNGTKPVYESDIAADSVRRPAILVIGPLPPPYHGGSVATSLVLRSRVQQELRVVHLDTTDRRGLRNIGRLDLGNVYLGLRHLAMLLRLLLVERPAAVYVPLAQNRLGLLRDAAFVVPSILSRRRVLLHVHGGGLREFHDAAGPGMRVLIRFMLARAERVIVLGEKLRPMVAGLVAPGRTAVLPNGVEDEFGRIPDRTGRSGPIRILFLGNLRPAKGLFDAIDAFAELRASGVDAQLDLAGGFDTAGDREYALQKIAPVTGAVRLHGVVTGNAKRELLEEADIFLFPSHSEGHPYVVLEAMSAGLPVIATQLPALQETVVEGQTGVLVPPRDPHSLARVLHELAADPQRRRDMGIAGRHRFLERYSFDMWSDGLSVIVTEALRG